MSTTTIETRISHRSLMNKSKDDLATMVLQYADLQGRALARSELLEKRISDLRELYSSAAMTCFMMESNERGDDRMIFVNQLEEVLQR